MGLKAPFPAWKIELRLLYVSRLSGTLTGVVGLIVDGAPFLSAAEEQPARHTAAATYGNRFI
jgi:hypothetical protein